MASKRTTAEVAEEIKNKFGEDIHIVGEYLGAQRNITIGCNNGHTWEVLATNLLSRGSRSRCNICEKGIYKRVINWNQGNIDKLKNYVSLTMPLNTIADKFGCSEAAITNACHTYQISRPKVDTTIKNLCDKLLEQNRELISDFDSIKSHTSKVIIKCNKGHIHTQNIYNIINDNTGCPSCFSANGISKGEQEVLEYITRRYTGSIVEHSRELLDDHKEIDIYLPELKIAFEYDGVWFHREAKIGKDYHLNKTNQLLNNQKAQLIHIYEDEWEFKKDIVKSRIDSILGRCYPIYARKCIVKRIDFPGDFLEDNHLQGKGAPTGINYGLYYMDELVQVCTFALPRFTSFYDYELVRLCSLTGLTIVGGASKLLKAFMRDYPNQSIVSYSDRRWSIGKVYKTLGFTKVSTSAPGYKYYKKLKSFSRHKFQKAKLKELFPDVYSDDLTEIEIMQLAGYYRVFDCGNDVWGLNCKSV